MSAEPAAPSAAPSTTATTADIPVVVAYDFSPVADEALRRAVELACLAPQHVLHVAAAIHPDSGLALAPTKHITSEYIAWAQHTIAARVADMVNGRAHADRVRYGVHVRVGRAASEILALAGELGAALVFIGSHNRTGAEKAALGSVSDRVTREARCSVVVAHQRASSTSR